MGQQEVQHELNRPPSFESVSAAVDRAGISTQTLRRRVACGQLVANRTGRLIRVDPDDVVHLPTGTPAKGAANAVRLLLMLECRPVQDSIEALARAARISLTTVSSARSTADSQGRTTMLTKREQEVLSHVVAGRTYAEIASELFLSEKTVSTHITNIIRKTRTANRVELADWAQRGPGAVP